MNRSRLTLWLKRIVWGLLIIGLGLIFLVPADANFDSILLLLGYTVLLFLTLSLAVTGLMLVYRRFFRTWPGWFTPIGLLIIGNLVVNNIWTIPHPNLSLFFTVLAVISIWMIGVATTILLWYRDVGLGLAGWSFVVFLWVLVLAWQFQGNLLDLWLLGINNPTAPQPLWWLNPLICITGWVVPLGICGFIWHTLRILINELK